MTEKQESYDHYPDGDVPSNICEFRNEFLCGFCNGSDDKKASCKRYGECLKDFFEYGTTDEDAEFILNGDEPGSKVRGIIIDDIMPAKPEPEVKKLVNDHWNYIESLLKIHGIEPSSIRIIGWHYRMAMEHGFKHGIEYAYSVGGSAK